MPRITQYEDAPLNGISQAAPQVRLPTQATDLVDAWVTIPDGWSKRHPMVYRGSFPEAIAAGDYHRSLIQSTVAGVPDAYLIIESDGTVRLLNADTYAPISVTVSTEAQSYLNEVVVAVEDIRTMTVEDYTFIANRQVPLEESGSSAPTRPFEAIVWIKLSDYARKYVLTIGGTTVTYICPEGNDQDDADDIDTSQIMDRMMNGGSVQPNGSVTPSGGIGSSLTSAGFTWTRRGSLLFLSRATDFSISVEDGLGGTAMVALKGSTPRISDLPVYAPDGFTIRIEGASASQTNDDYWVRFEESGTGTGATGVYKETIAPGASYGLDPETLPVGLTYNVVGGTWSLDVLPWTAREVGDEDTSPDPLTIGEHVMDIGWFRARPRILTESVALYCGSANPFRIYPSTLTTVLDSDPFGLINPGAARAFFSSGITFDQRDVLFGQGVQAVVSSEGPFTARTARIDLLAEYPYSGTLPVLPAGDNVHFTSTTSDSLGKTPKYDRLWELGINGPAQRTEGLDLTVGQPRLLPHGLDRSATLTSSYASLYGQYEEPNLFLHLFRGSGQDRIQSGFFRVNLPTGWTLGDILTSPKKGATEFRIAAFDPDGRLHELSMDMQAQLRDSQDSDFLTCLDVRLTDADVTVTYNAGTDRSTITHPALVFGADEPWAVSVRGSDQDLPEGFLAAGVSGAGLVIEGDWTGITFYVGLVYDSYWDVTEIIHRGGSNNKPIYEAGSLQLRRLRVDLGPSAFMSVRTKVERRPWRTYASVPDFETPAIQKGPWEVPLGGPADAVAIRIRNDSHLQGYALGFEWSAEHNQRSRAL